MFSETTASFFFLDRFSTPSIAESVGIIAVEIEAECAFLTGNFLPTDFVENDFLNAINDLWPRECDLAIFFLPARALLAALEADASRAIMALFTGG